MDLQPFPDRETLVAGEIVGNEVNVARRVRLFDRLEQLQVALCVQRGTGERERLAVFDS
jgi:hypothetical protein